MSVCLSVCLSVYVSVCLFCCSCSASSRSLGLSSPGSMLDTNTHISVYVFILSHLVVFVNWWWWWWWRRGVVYEGRSLVVSWYRDETLFSYYVMDSVRAVHINALHQRVDCAAGKNRSKTSRATSTGSSHFTPPLPPSLPPSPSLPPLSVCPGHLPLATAT